MELRYLWQGMYVLNMSVFCKIFWWVAFNYWNLLIVISFSTFFKV